MEKKHIGLLTLPLNSNYGGIMQIVALQCFLNERGYETTLINLRYPESFKKRIFRTIIEKQCFFDIKHIRFRKKIARKLHKFIETNIVQKTQQLYNREAFLKEVEKQHFDAIVVGSDQIWRIDYLYGIWQNVFLKGISNIKIKKISYAASFGKSEWEFPNLKNEIGNLLKDFNGISVREDSGVQICKDEFEIDNAVHVLDPTLLINKEFYNKFITKDNPKKGVFTYILDSNNENTEVLDYFSKLLNKEIYSINAGKSITDLKKEKNYEKPCMEDWLQSFYDADFVITDSFHGTVFSIIFNKPFFSIGNKKRGLSRFTSLLSMLDLEDRLLDIEDLSNLYRVNSVIDFDKVNSKIKELQLSSSNFLLSTIESK